MHSCATTPFRLPTCYLSPPAVNWGPHTKPTRHHTTALQASTSARVAGAALMAHVHTAPHLETWPRAALMDTALKPVNVGSLHPP